MKFLGKGTFNQVLLEKDGKTAIRIAELRNPSILKHLEKSEKVVKEIESANLSPSIFKILEDGIVYDVLPEEFGISDESPNQWFVQKIEYLPFKFKKITYDDMFFLLWFFSYTSTEYGFVHKDVKANNILLRDYGRNVTFKFKYYNLTYKITTSLVPVVMDYDHSSTKDLTFQIFAGTISYAPPETLLQKLCGIEIPMYNYGYDWWSLGIMICYKYIFPKVKIDQNLVDQYVEYNLNIFDHLDDPDLVTDIVTTILRISIIKNAISKTFHGPEYLEIFEEFYTVQNLTFINKAIKISNVNNFNIPSGLYPIVQRLLSWTAEQRTFNRNPWRYLEKFYKSVDDNFVADFTYEKK